MNKLILIYTILILGILVNIFWLFLQSYTNQFVIAPIYPLEQNDTEGYLEYKDKQARIEFQYPENWYINQLRPNMIVITPFFDYYLPSFTDYYFDYGYFNLLKSELQKRSETLDSLTLGIESMLGFNKNSSTFNNSILDSIISIPGEYEQIQPLTIDKHIAYKIIRPQAIQIALEIGDTQPNQIFHILIFVQDTKNINQLIKNGIEKIISSIKVLDPFVIENILSVGKKLIAPGEVQNISIYTMDKYYNKPLPYTNVSIKVIYPSGFELYRPNTTSTVENGRFYYEWTIPDNAVLGKYSISITTVKKDYAGSTGSNFFVIDNKKIPISLVIASIDISPINANASEFKIDFETINPNTENIRINQINYSVYYNNFKLPFSEYDEKSIEHMSIDTFTSKFLKSLEDKSVEEERNKEIIRDSKILHRSEIPENIWNDIFLGKSLDLKINGTFSYNPSNLIEIENKEEFDFLYTTNKLP